ncbi:MAG: beta-N-acetylhexosaminidase [Wenzhouxiangellaceae bacterium]|nr:beta-N-acetylhexosaminidase [Wenzhouxiangellaceae bacterium]
MNCGLVVGIDGLSLNEASRQTLQHPAVVGVILFSRNYQAPAQLRQLCEQIRGLKDPRLLICVDQEGGRVQRLKEGFTALPALGVLGRWYGSHPERALDLAYRHGRVMAAEVLGHGIDLSLAPVLDLDRSSAVIGDRAFSADPQVVTRLAGHYLAGMRDAGMKSCGKHFPGHGSVAADSHTDQVLDPRSREAIDEDLQPFRSLAAQLHAVMPAHVCFPDVDERPAGFSDYWIGRVLRIELGFKGIVISDDLDMAGAAAAGDTRSRWQACEAAACDLALVCEPRSAAALLAATPDSIGDFAEARAAAGALLGRAAFTLDEQQQVPEFRAWKKSLRQIAEDHQ